MRNMKFVIAFLSLSFGHAGAVGQIVVDHSAQRGVGIASDSLFHTGGLDPTWQRIADDFRLDAAATIRHITWWGYYTLDIVPTVETMRFRFYEARPGDGLPGDYFFEESVVNPPRSPTGVMVPEPPGTVGRAEEHQFEVNLATPLSVDANTPYWLEIVQVGDLDTRFLWSGANAEDTSKASINPSVPDWQLRPGITDSAFQLSTIPEPATLAFIALGMGLVPARRRTPARLVSSKASSY